MQLNFFILSAGWTEFSQSVNNSSDGVLSRSHIGNYSDDRDSSPTRDKISVTRQCSDVAVVLLLSCCSKIKALDVYPH